MADPTVRTAPRRHPGAARRPALLLPGRARTAANRTPSAGRVVTNDVGADDDRRGGLRCTGKASRPIPGTSRGLAWHAPPSRRVSRACHAAPFTGRTGPAPAGTARAADLRERHRSSHGNTVPPARRITHDPRPDSDDRSTSCNAAGSRRWPCSLSARRRPTRRDAATRKPCHHQGVPLASHLVPVPGVDGAFMAVVPHGHPTGPAGVGSGRGDHRATPLGERSSEGVRVSAHPTSRHEVSVPHTRTGVRESGWRLARPGAPSESQGSPTANKCVAPAIGLRQQRSVLRAWAAG